ncbi:MAG: efflux RND transporter periplasmic adaptor subunit [Alphaproteobacteria bacterium]
MNSLSKKALIIIPLVIILGIGALLTARFFMPKAVEVVRVTRGPAVQAVYATGTVEPTIMLPIAPRNSARLTALNVDEGSRVIKGQVLAQLEDENLRQTIAEQQAREEYARRVYERNAALLKNNTVSRQELDRSRSEWEAAKAALARAKAELNFAKLVAPADGNIIRRDGEIGQLIPANQALFWMSCCAPLRISAEVDEEDIPLVQPGQKVLIRADAFPDQTFTGKVQSITPKGDAIARSYRVRISLTQETPLLIGMTTETKF